jgi:predicted negative regulator of RcsB-dependent stress response
MLFFDFAFCNIFKKIKAYFSKIIQQEMSRNNNQKKQKTYPKKDFKGKLIYFILFGVITISGYHQFENHQYLTKRSTVFIYLIKKKKKKKIRKTLRETTPKQGKEKESKITLLRAKCPPVEGVGLLHLY